MLAPRMSSVNVKGLRQTEESYSVLFTPVATLPISMKISSGNYTKCVPWSEIPGPNDFRVPSLLPWSCGRNFPTWQALCPGHFAVARIVGRNSVMSEQRHGAIFLHPDNQVGNDVFKVNHQFIYILCIHPAWEPMLQFTTWQVQFSLCHETSEVSQWKLLWQTLSLASHNLAGLM